MLLTKLRKMKNKKGFTLVELIVVIAIIAVLAAVLVPMMGSYLENARISSADASAKTVRTSMDNYTFAGSDGSGGRSATALNAKMEITIVDGTPTVSNTDDSNWRGGSGSAQIKAMFTGNDDGSIAISFNGNRVISVLYTAQTGKASTLAGLLGTDGLPTGIGDNRIVSGIDTVVGIA